MPPAPLTRLAPELDEAVDEELEDDDVEVPVAVPVVAAVEAPDTPAEVAVALTVLVVEYWLARAQYWLTRPA